MRVACIGDLHVTDSQLRGPHGHEALLNRLTETVGEVCPDLVLVTGDLTGQDVPHRSTPRERNAIVDFFLRIANQGSPVVVCRGNHDPNGEWDFLNHLRAERGIFHSSEPEFLEFPDLCGVMTLPWLDRALFPAEDSYSESVRQQYLEAINTCQGDIRRMAKAKCPTFILGHLAPANGMLREGQPTVPTADPLVEPQDLLSAAPFEALFTGHYHLAQALGDRAFCAGSTFVSRYGEDWPKTWVLYDTGPKVFETFDIDQLARVVLGLDMEREMVASITPSNACPVQPGTPIIRAAEAFRGEQAPILIKLVARYDESLRGRADALIRSLREDLRTVTDTVVLDIHIDRVVKFREGASEVAKASTLAEKIDAYAKLRRPPLKSAVVTRAKMIAHEVYGEIG